MSHHQKSQLPSLHGLKLCWRFGKDAKHLHDFEASNGTAAVAIELFQESFSSGKCPSDFAKLKVTLVIADCGVGKNCFNWNELTTFQNVEHVFEPGGQRIIQTITDHDAARFLSQFQHRKVPNAMEVLTTVFAPRCSR